MFSGFLYHVLGESQTVAEPVTEGNFLDHGLFKYIIEATGKSLENWQYAVLTLIWAAMIIIPYLLGSLNFAIIVSKRMYHDDIRKYGSGNAGLTNMLRTYGKKAAVYTLVGDSLKTVVSISLGYLLHGNIGAYVTAFFCILGHIFPIYYRFQGGKGVLTVSVSILMLDPVIFLIVFAIFAIIVGFTKYVSLGSIMCMMIYPLIVNKFYNGLPVLFSVLFAAVVVFMHRSNIVRLWHGEENKISFKKREKSDPKDNDIGK